MSAVIYNESSTHIYKHYKTMAAAKAALTRAHNRGQMTIQTSFGKGIIRGEKLEALAVCTMEYFNSRVDYDVEVVSIMAERNEDGTMPTVTIKRSAEGSCIDPSTERYWSM